MIQILMPPLLFSIAALALVLALYLLTAGAAPRAAHRLLAAAFLLVGVQAGLVALQLTLPVNALLYVRPVLAMALAPLLFLHLECARRASASLRASDAIHVVGPALMGVLLLGGLRGDFIDAMIISSLAGYAALTAWRARMGAETFQARGAPAARSLVRWRLIVIAWLVTMALGDLAILIELAGVEPLRTSITFMLTASLIVLFLATNVLMSLHRAGPMAWVSMQLRRLPRRAAPIDAPATYRKLVEHMESTRAFLDPNLTVVRLARQTALPQRSVSEAINQSEGVSFSRWVNNWRVREAQRLIRDDPQRSLLDVLLASGFQTKSNFNRVFKECVGLPPSEWRSQGD